MVSFSTNCASCGVYHPQPTHECLALLQAGITIYWYHLQTHRVFEVGRDPWKTAGPASLLRQGHPEPVAQHHVQAASEYLQGWRLHNLPGQSVPVLGHPHSEKMFPDVQKEPPVFQVVPTASGPVSGHH